MLVTGPRQYAHKLTSLLVSSGAMVTWLPCVQITGLEDPHDVQVLSANSRAHFLRPALVGMREGERETGVREVGRERGRGRGWRE